MYSGWPLYVTCLVPSRRLITPIALGIDSGTGHWRAGGVHGDEGDRARSVARAGVGTVGAEGVHRHGGPVLGDTGQHLDRQLRGVVVRPVLRRLGLQHGGTGGRRAVRRNQVPRGVPGRQRLDRLIEVRPEERVRPRVEEVERASVVRHLVRPEVGPVHLTEQRRVDAGAGDRRTARRQRRPIDLLFSRETGAGEQSSRLGVDPRDGATRLVVVLSCIGRRVDAGEVKRRAGGERAAGAGAAYHEDLSVRSVLQVHHGRRARRSGSRSRCRRHRDCSEQGHDRGACTDNQRTSEHVRLLLASRPKRRARLASPRGREVRADGGIGAGRG